MFSKIIVLKTLANLSVSNLSNLTVSESSLIKLQALKIATLWKRDPKTQVFSCEIWDIFKNISSFRFPIYTFIKKETPAKMFFCDFFKIFKKIFWQNTSRWLLLVFICEFSEVFQKTFFIEHLWETSNFMYKLQNFNHQIQ